MLGAAGGDAARGLLPAHGTTGGQLAVLGGGRIMNGFGMGGGIFFLFETPSWLRPHGPKGQPTASGSNGFKIKRSKDTFF